MLSELLVAVFQSPVVTEPGERSFHDVSELPQAASVGLRDPRQQRHDSALQSSSNVLGSPVSSIALEDLRSSTGPSPWSLNMNVVEHLQRRLRVVKVGRRGLDDQRNAVRVGYDVALTALFSSVRGVGPGVDPPKTARTEALSTTARERSIARSLPKALTRISCTFGHTPAAVQSRNRRQQVTPSPQPNSGGRRFHGIPDFSTKMIPAKQAWSGTRGRPPSGFGFSGGSNGWIADQSSGGTSENDMAGPLSWLSMSIHRQSASDD